jgi:hypothetical protein
VRALRAILNMSHVPYHGGEQRGESDPLRGCTQPVRCGSCDACRKAEGR